MTRPRLGSDTDIYSFFEPESSERELETYKLRWFITNKEIKRNFYPFMHIQELIEVSKRTENGWEVVGNAEIYMFDLNMDDSFYNRKRWRDRGFSWDCVQDLHTEIRKVYDEKRKARTRELAKQRKQKLQAEANAKGITVDDVLFERRKERLSKKFEKETEKLKRQVALTFEYMKIIENLEKEIERCREILLTPDIHLLNLRDSKWNVEQAARSIISSLQYHIRIEKEKEQ